MGYECFEVSISDDIAHITLSRPERRNAMSPEFWDELPEIVEDIDANAKARVIVISSAIASHRATSGSVGAHAISAREVIRSSFFMGASVRVSGVDDEATF